MVHCGDEIGAYIAQPNFHGWEILKALPRIWHSGKTLLYVVDRN
jgi:hypothetical protein